MQNKTKFILWGAIVLVVVVLAIMLWPRAEKRVSPEPLTVSGLETPKTNNPEVNNPTSSTAAGTPSANAPVTGEPAVPGVNGPATAPAAAANPAANGAIGAWTSATKGKGIQGSGKATLNGILFQLNLAGDVALVIQKVENNTGTGTITFNNVCVTGTKTVSGKTPTAFSPQCEKTYSRPAVMQIDGDKISYAGKSDLGADISLTGTLANDSIAGTFTRDSSSGNITGTFNLVRVK